MPTAVKKEEEVEIIQEEQDAPDSPSSVTVDLDKKLEEEKKEEPKQEIPKGASQEDIRKLHNTIAYEARKYDKIQKELQELKDQLKASSLPKAEQKEVIDEIDKLAQQDWKAGVKLLVKEDIEDRVNAVLKKRDEDALASQRRYAVDQELDNSKKLVMQKYPKIEEDGSEENKLYLEVINEHPELLKNTHGPEIAMYRMEERMRAMGRIPPTVRPVIDKEVNRLVRAGASSVIGRTASPNGKITLTKEQKEFCDHYKIPYERYAKNLKADEARGGVEA